MALTPGNGEQNRSRTKYIGVLRIAPGEPDCQHVVEWMEGTFVGRRLGLSEYRWSHHTAVG